MNKKNNPLSMLNVGKAFNKLKDENDELKTFIESIHMAKLFEDYSGKLKELDELKTELKLVKECEKNSVEIADDAMDELAELREAAKPFLEIAENWISVDGRSTYRHYSDVDPVIGCNNAVVTIGDCKKLIKYLRN